MICNLRLDRRLRDLVDCIDGSAVADVGCDHGKVSVAALVEGRANKVIACDVSQKSLKKAVDLARGLGVKNIEFRAGDGLSVISDGEVDQVVIAGMGGREIMKILAHMPKGIKKLVLSPQKNVIELRQFLSQNGFYISRDIIVEEGGKFYVIMTADVDSKKDCTLDRYRLLLGDRGQGEDFFKYITLIEQKYGELSKKSKECVQCKLYEEMLALVGERK